MIDRSNLFSRVALRAAEVAVGHHSLLPFRQLNFDGRRVSLGNKALQILSRLAVANGQVVTLDDLIDTVWCGLIVEDNAVHVHVSALRKALGTDAKLLVTVRGLGYKLEACCFNSQSVNSL